MSNKISYGLKYLIITLLLFCNAPWTAAQQPARKVTLNLESVSFENCLKAIERQTHYTFLYRKDLINLSKLVSFSCKDEALTAVLDSLLPSQNIAYRIQDLTIVLTPKQVRNKKDPDSYTGKYCR
ncbi:STN domain-containing protein [Bacteroides thetaiotaomicron]|nr:STN domain-containing protein [Bacteroides thetaiotaomicron]MCS3371577.1 STN domain-containing protein [Bacteroides thetaiotaomicron]